LAQGCALVARQDRDGVMSDSQYYLIMGWLLHIASRTGDTPFSVVTGLIALVLFVSSMWATYHGD
jgi:hypothetical protein